MSEEQTKQNVSLEETFEQIETIIKQLESPEVTLDDSSSVSGRRGKVKDM